MAEGNNAEHIARLLVEMEKHIAFLEGAMGIEMSPVFKEDDIILSEIIDSDIACRLVFASSASESGWMEDSILFENLQDMVTFLENVELLFRIARVQQRGN